jgi:uncharacterized cupin superfamily protein
MPDATAHVPAIFDAQILAVQLPGREPHPVGHDSGCEAAGVELFNDGVVETGVWECTPGTFPSAKDGISEIMHFVAGDATITSSDGTTHEIRPGSTFVAPDGWRGEWEIRHTVRKLYVIWTTPATT